MSDFRDISAKELVLEKSKVITVLPSTTLQEALQLLNKHNVTGLPIFSPDQGWLGFISAFDIMTYIAFSTHFKSELEETNIIPLTSFTNLDRPVGDLLDISLETSSDMWHATGTSETLSSIASRMSSGIHRMLIAVDDEARLLTQTDLIKFLFEKDVHNLYRKSTINQLGLGKTTHKVASISYTLTALTAFRLIYREQVNAVAVTNEDGVIVATISSSDVRGLLESDLPHLLRPTLEYLAKRGITQRKQIQVNENNTLEEVMAALLEGKVHRVWVCEEQRPVSVITMSDVIRLWYK